MWSAADVAETHIHSNFSALRGRLRRLPHIHQTTFRALIEHLGRVQSHAGQNKMDAKVRLALLPVGWGEQVADLYRTLLLSSVCHSSISAGEVELIYRLGHIWSRSTTERWECSDYDSGEGELPSNVLCTTLVVG